MNLQNSTSGVLELIRLKVKVARCPEVEKVLTIKNCGLLRLPGFFRASWRLK